MNVFSYLIFFPFQAEEAAAESDMPPLEGDAEDASRMEEVD